MGGPNDKVLSKDNKLGLKIDTEDQTGPEARCTGDPWRPVKMMFDFDMGLMDSSQHGMWGRLHATTALFPYPSHPFAFHFFLFFNLKKYIYKKNKAQIKTVMAWGERSSAIASWIPVGRGVLYNHATTRVHLPNGNIWFPCSFITVHHEGWVTLSLFSLFSFSFFFFFTSLAPDFICSYHFA